MADVKMPESIPCQFDEAWRGQCKKPSTNGFCTAHEGKICVSCGATAVKSCDCTPGALICGVPLCKNCCHELNGDKHIPVAIFKQQLQDEEHERKETERSRTSPVQRRDSKTGLPLNLFELLKGDWRSEGFRLEKCYLLELTHGLMGFFPAITKGDRKPVITTDKALLLDIWKMLPARESQMVSFMAYVNAEKGIAYADRTDDFAKEESKPRLLLDRSEYQTLIASEKDGQPFEWAPGLIGFGSLNRETFLKMIDDSAKRVA